MLRETITAAAARRVRAMSETATTIKVGPYKGYYGTAEYCPSDEEYHGLLTGIRDAVTFVGGSSDDAISEFHHSVDDYLEFCELLGREPEKP